jgi:hypothetical protein
MISGRSPPRIRARHHSVSLTINLGRASIKMALKIIMSIIGFLSIPSISIPATGVK